MTHCSICLDKTCEPFTSQCNHSFCNRCILEWITQHDECPLCRKAISAQSRNPFSYDDDDEDIYNRYQIYIDGNISEDESNIVNDILDDFITSYETSETKYKWKDNGYGSYLSVRNGEYFIDLCFRINKHKNIRNCYIIEVKVNKRIMVKQRHIQKTHTKIILNTRNNYKGKHYFCK